MKVGDRIMVEIVITGEDRSLGCFTADLSSEDWFISEDSRITQTSKHWS